MEIILNLITKYGENILLGIVLFWVVCTVIVAIFMPSWLKNAPLMGDDFDVEENILRNRKQYQDITYISSTFGNQIKVMIKKAIDAYKETSRKGRIAQRALEILKASKKVSTRYGVPYNIRSVYAVINNQYDDPNVDEAVIMACFLYKKEKEITEYRLNNKAVAML